MCRLFGLHAGRRVVTGLDVVDARLNTPAGWRSPGRRAINCATRI